MKRSVICVLACLLAQPCALAADRTLVAWEFNRAGDAEGWFAAHALAPLSVSGGVLKTRASGGDPYMISGQGDTFDVAANDFQYIEIRLKCSKEGGAEFFWASTTEGKDAGFEAGKERAFAVKADRRFHVHRVFPVWVGRATRLRFDPPEGATIEIDYIRVMQAPISRHEPTSPRWNFRTEAAGGFIPTSGCSYESVPGGLRVTLDAENSLLTSPVLDLKSSDHNCVTLHLTASARVQMTLNWTDGADGNFPGSNVVPFDVSAGEDWVTLHLSEVPTWTGAVRRLALGISGKERASVTLHSMGFGRNPEGPAKLSVVSLAGEKSIYAVGEPIRLLLRIRNDGGLPARGVRSTLSMASANVRLARPAPNSPIELAPGARCDVLWYLTARKAGVAGVGILLEGEGLFRPARAASQIIVTERIAEVAVAGKRSYAIAKGVAALVGNERLRLTFARGKSGFESGRIDLIEGHRQRIMGCLPYLARVAVGTDRDAAPVPLVPVGTTSTASTAALRMRGSRAGVTVDVSYSATTGRPWVDAIYRLSASRPVALRAFQGPWLWAGEGSFADDQDHALFPGVEWLVKGERSSTSLDIAPPMHTRFAPHPNWITVPSMAVEKDNAIVGLMWDPLQKWDGSRTRPAAVFASPNFLEARRNHLLGLFLPSIPEYVAPNTLLARKPYALRPGRPITLRASLFVRAKADVTDAALLWYERFTGRPAAAPALPPMPRSYADTIDMSMRSFEKILWKPDAQGWMPVIGWAPGRDLGVAAMYDTAAHVRRTAPERETWRARAQQVGGSAGDITFALRGSGSPEAALGAILSGGRSAAEAQPEGARYAFYPDGPRKSLGPAGSTAVGIAAALVENLMNAALRTGDARTLQAGLAGLAFMDQFDVPRAAQVWECPLHSPDILASGQACRAYLAGYRMTRDPRYLKKAVFWARTGLPFVYAWQAPDMPKLMKYATIPIFGATFYTGSWFGVPVQWNGLDYASACLELASHDTSLPWRQIGEGITISGMNQQSVRALDYGTYTDNWNLVTNAECVVCMLAPGGILANVFRLLGVSHIAGVDGVVTGSGWIAVNGPGSVSNARLSGDNLTARAAHFTGEVGTVAIMPVVKPQRVTVDGTAYEECRTGSPNPGQWKYSARLGLVTVAIRFGDRPATVSASGIARLELVSNQTEWRFDEAGEALGWIPASDLSPPTAADGALRMEITGGDPYFVSPPFGVSAASVTGVAICARLSKPGGEVFWGNRAGGPAAAREVPFHLPADGSFHEVYVDLTGHPEWRGAITQVRVDFNGGPGDTVELKWVKVVKREAR